MNDPNGRGQMIEDGSSIGRHAKSRLVRIAVRVLKGFFIAALVVAGILYFNVYLPQGEGPAGPPVPAEPFKHIWSEKEVYCWE